MTIELDGTTYNVFITRKNNKNMYLRVKSDGIYITCNYLVPKSLIINFIKNNKESVIKEYNRQQRKEEKKIEFYYLGNKYDVIITNTVSKIEFYNNKVFVKNKTYLNTFLKNEAERVLNEREKICYNLFEENIPYPKVMIGKMTRKWGYNRKGGGPLIKLNFDLIKYSIDEIDYVIIHELCHFLEFNHSRNFWRYVKKYCPNYKEYQNILKEE
jgi:predicted metal-dependent hydrolase